MSFWFGNAIEDSEMVVLMQELLPRVTQDCRGSVSCERRGAAEVRTNVCQKTGRKGIMEEVALVQYLLEVSLGRNLESWQQKP